MSAIFGYRERDAPSIEEIFAMSDDQAHLILRISPHHRHHLRFHHLSLPRPFTPYLKLISFTNPFLHITLIPSGLTSRILTCTVLKEHWRCLF